MIGKPKYKLGDRVKFDIDGRRYHGNIYIIDAYGTFEDESDVSYDIMVDDWGDYYNEECLFKHINERMIIDKNIFVRLINMIRKYWFKIFGKK